MPVIVLVMEYKMSGLSRCDRDILAAGIIIIYEI